MASFEIYTYFGRVLATFTSGKDELHHIALEQARTYLKDYETATGSKAWIRFK